jgi:hypothetical protein
MAQPNQNNKILQLGIKANVTIKSSDFGSVGTLENVVVGR